MVWELVACPPRTGVPPNPSLLILDPTIDPAFPLPELVDHPVMNQPLIVEDPSDHLSEKQDSVPVEQTGNTAEDVILVMSLHVILTVC